MRRHRMNQSNQFLKGRSKGKTLVWSEYVLRTATTKFFLKKVIYELQSVTKIMGKTAI